MKKFEIKTDALLEQQYYIQAVRREVEEGGKRYYHIETYGCQMNEHDSEKMRGLLEWMGYEETAYPEKSDLVIFNTCAVRENAELRALGNLGHFKPLKEKKPDMILAVCGCMVQQETIREVLQKSYPYVDLVFGTHNFHQLPHFLWDVLSRKERVFSVWEDSEFVIEGLPAKRQDGVKAFVNIMQGCNNFCSYCIVPVTRGRERSREVSDILNEVQELVQSGVREITLLGQNVNSYGKNMAEPHSFAQLLEQLQGVEGLERIRFMTSHPKDLSDELIEGMASLPKVCKSLHLPLQSGSSRILKKMNRHYKREDYLLLVKKLRQVMPDIGLSTDIIIGFPGETKEDVEETIELLREVRFDSAFTFLYSKRSGTPAALMEDDVTEEEKHTRFDAMLTVLNEIVAEKNAGRTGNLYQVLVEGESPKKTGWLLGRSNQNDLISFPGDASLLGKMVEVKITRARRFSLEGELQ